MRGKLEIYVFKRVEEVEKSEKKLGKKNVFIL